MNYKLLFRMAAATVVALALVLTTVQIDAKQVTEAAIHETRLGHFSQLGVMPALYTVKQAKEGDIVHILLHSPGGSVYAGLKLIKEITKSKAQVIGTIPKFCASMCAMTTLHLDEVLLAKDAKIMFHLYHYNGYTATPGTWLSKIDPVMNAYFIDSFQKMEDIGLLTDIEHRMILKGYDVWIDGAEYNKRLGAIK